MANDGDVLLFSGGHQSFSTLPYEKIASRMAVAVNAATTYTSGTVVLSAGANITLGTNGQTITISGNAAAAAQTNQTLGLYGLSQTIGGASSTTLDARTLSINAYGAISVGFSAGSIQLSAPNVVAQSSVTFGNANGVSFGLAGSTVTASVAAQSVQTQSVVVLSASNASFTSGTVVISGANGISVGTAAQQINISGEGLMPWYFHNSGASVNATQQTNASASFAMVVLPHAMTFSRVDAMVNLSTASSAAANTAAIAISSVAVIYSRNDSTLNPIVGASGTVTVTWASNTGQALSITGQRLVSFPLATSLSAGVYWVGMHMSTTSGLSVGTATTALNASIFMLCGNLGSNITATGGFQDIGAGALVASVNMAYPMMGLLSSALTATAQTIQQSQITVTGGGEIRGNLYLLFRNVP